MTNKNGNDLLKKISFVFLTVLFLFLAAIFGIVAIATAIILNKDGLKFLLELEAEKNKSTEENPIGFLFALMVLIRKKIEAFVFSENLANEVEFFAEAPAAAEEKTEAIYPVDDMDFSFEKTESVILPLTKTGTPFSVFKSVFSSDVQNLGK
jgi:hypothetical protein